jgi:hypothetical protein
MWHYSHRADPRALVLADKHYSRQTPGSKSFVPPGRCVVFLTPDADACWVTSWPFAQYVKHAWAGAWMNSFFRREPSCPYRASDLIVAAIAATRAHRSETWDGSIPDLGMVTFIDAEKTKPKQQPGYCYLKAGFEVAGMTKGGLHAVQMRPEWMPRAEAAL